MLPSNPADLQAAREHMLVDHLARRGIRDLRVLRAFAEVPREAFVPRSLAHAAYEDTALPLQLGQTISQPYIVAVTLAALHLTGKERVLEIGTGSGYAAALLSRLAHEVYTMERLPALAQAAAQRLAALGFHNVHVAPGDGSLGWSEHAPYDAIAVAAAGPHAPEALLRQLAPRGRLVMPVESGGEQTLTVFQRGTFGRLVQKKLERVWFVPLIGKDAHAPRD